MSIASEAIKSQSEIEIKKSFIKWQCRVRQIAMRDNGGKPDEGIMPSLRLLSSDTTKGSVITLIHKRHEFSVTKELIHMAKKTLDPAQRRDQAIRFFSATYYQKYAEFSDILTATFQPNSSIVRKIIQSKSCFLTFDAFSQQYDIKCEVRSLDKDDSLYGSTIAHNSLFNPYLHPETEVLAFEPNWKESISRNSFAY